MVLPQREHPRLGGSDVTDADVQMDLLREVRVWPARRLVIGCVLEAQANLAVADVDPVTGDSGDRQPEQFGVEPAPGRVGRGNRTPLRKAGRSSGALETAVGNAESRSRSSEV